jgi:hypothetical protein
LKSYNIVDDEEKQPVIWPKRVQILQEEYAKASKNIGKKGLRMNYRIESVDYQEKIFEDRVRMKPDSLKVTINALYRVKNNRTNKEYYFYNAAKSCKNALNDPESFSYQGYGYHRVPIVSLRYNEQTNRKEPDVTSFEQGYELPWKKEEVKKLLDSSFLPCEYFYVGYTGNNPNDPITSPYYQIHNLEDFLEGSFEDLFDMGRLGISYKEQASLYMVEAARQKEKENREAALGMGRKPNKVYT